MRFFSHVITAAEETAGEVRNIATARGTWSDSNAPVEDEAQVTISTRPAPPAPNPKLSLLVSAAVEDDNRNTVAGDPGDLITYTFKVTNGGNTVLRNLRMRDPRLPQLDCQPLAELAPGASATFVCTGNQHRITPADAQLGSVSNTAEALADTASATLSATDHATTPTVVLPTPKPGLSLQVTPTPLDGNGNGVTGEAGDLVSFSYILTNTGTVPLTDLTVRDRLLLPGLACTPVARLEPGASVTLQCTGNIYTLTTTDINAGQITHTATASTATSGALSSTATVTLPLAAQGEITPIPTLSGWMLALLSLLMAGIGMRRRA